MTKRKSTAFFDAGKFAKSLSELIESLPSREAKEQIDSQLSELIQFINTLQSRVREIPTQQDAATTRIAIKSLENLFLQIKSNPILATATGSKAVSPRQKPLEISQEEIDRANITIARFDSLSIDQLRGALTETNLRELEAIASALGVRTSRRMAREAMVQQIATRITNTRGYRNLRDGTN